MSTRDDLVDLIELGAVTRHSFGQIADAILKAGWRPPAREITTVEELEALPNNEERAIPQEAVEAAAKAMFVMQHRVDVELFGKKSHKALADACIREAKNALAAAEPHLRKKWAEEIREGVNPPDTGKAHEWRRGFITGVLRTARFLEGAGE